MTRGLRAARARWSAGLLVLLLLVAAAGAGCSVLIGVSGDPVVVGDEAGDAHLEAAAMEAGGQPDTATVQDAATADEPDALDPDADDGAPE